MKRVGNQNEAFRKNTINLLKQRLALKNKKDNPRVSVDFSLAAIHNLDSINEEPFDAPLSSERKQCSIRHTVDPETLKKISTYRALKLPTLRNMSEEECLSRYLEDPFFRKKLEYELQFLRRSTLQGKNSKEDRQNGVNSIITEFQKEGNSMTFREYRQSEEERRRSKKDQFESLLRKVSSEGAFQCRL